MTGINFRLLAALYLALTFGWINNTVLLAQVISRPGPDGAAKAHREVAGASIDGTWTYRSFRSHAELSDPDAPLDSLLFGQGKLDLMVDEAGVLSGTLGGTGWDLRLEGTQQQGDPTTIRFQGKGSIGGEEWVHDYLGYVVPTWPNGIDQRPAIVGTIVRTVDHSGGAAQAGYVAQWIAVKHDETDPEASRANRNLSNALNRDALNYRKRVGDQLLEEVRKESQPGCLIDCPLARRIAIG